MTRHRMKWALLKQLFHVLHSHRIYHIFLVKPYWNKLMHNGHDLAFHLWKSLIQRDICVALQLHLKVPMKSWLVGSSLLRPVEDADNKCWSSPMGWTLVCCAEGMGTTSWKLSWEGWKGTDIMEACGLAVGVLVGITEGSSINGSEVEWGVLSGHNSSMVVNKGFLLKARIISLRVARMLPFEKQGKLQCKEGQFQMLSARVYQKTDDSSVVYCLNEVIRVSH